MDLLRRGFSSKDSLKTLLPSSPVRVFFPVDILPPGSLRKGVRTEWHLDKAQNFVAQAFASAGVRPAFKEDSAGDLLHFLDRFPKVAFVFHRLADGFKLLVTYGHGDRFACDFPGPLVA